MRSLCHIICEKKFTDGINNIAYSSHSGSIIGTAHSLLSVKSYKDFLSMDCDTNCTRPNFSSDETLFFMQQQCPDGSQVDARATWTNRLTVDKKESIEKTSRATVALASTL